MMTGEAWNHNTFNRQHSTLKFDHSSVDAPGPQYSYRDQAQVDLSTLPDAYLPDGRNRARISEV